ncbi:hypothetical protein AALP_AA8G296900 [Arabis alpina]|uniref:Uncharacterized protein n=1 Tax=Arabis alpina TaxID=50452 RepID=A0A087GAB3_ARAAL|nr:hypothetical protein AALP_AA8G296900 [Arabis alpina]
MPPKKMTQQLHDEQTDAFRSVLVDFQQDPRDVLCTAVESALRTVIQVQAQAQQQRPAPPPRNNAPGVLDGEEEVDFEDENPFAGLQEQPDAHHHRAVVFPREDNRRWESGFKLDLPNFHGSVQPEELLDWISSVEELLTFKQVPEEMRVPLVAT